MSSSRSTYSLPHRLLLRDAVDAAAVFVDAVDVARHDRAVGVEGGQRLLGVAVAGGVAELLQMVYDRLRVKAAVSGLVGHKRQAEALQKAMTALDVDPDMPPEFLAESLRHAAQSLAAMVGRVGAEDYLDEIFASFCIGK